uniref:Neurotransmitter-gated ion-channel ligand-binding domain-containing protein n=1 Tax=Anopheles epiroticus TaxID=199890 RepID=A0A182PTI5_9DIPT
SLLCDRQTDNQEHALKQHLFCNGYNHSIRPSKSEFDHFYIYTWAFILDFDFHWKDDSLAWNSSLWSNITMIHPNADQIWFPHFENINSKYNEISSLQCLNNDCILRNTGNIDCAPICKISAMCSSDYSRWPFNTLVCRVWFANRDKELVDEVKFGPIITDMPISKDTAVGKWCVTKFESNRTVLNMPGATNHPVRELIFYVEHNPYFVIATVYLPTVVLFVFASMIMTFLLFVITVINRWVYALESNPPNLVTRCLRTFKINPAMSWIMKADYLSIGQKVVTSNNDRQKPDWPMFVMLVDRCVLFVYISAYLILFWVYIPLQHTHNQYDRFGNKVCTN